MIRREVEYRLFTIALFCVVFLGGCTMGPDFFRPFSKADQSTGFINNIYIQTQETRGQQSISRWWERLDDPLLDQYVDQLLNQNLALVEAGERVIQLRERTSLASSDYYPSLSTDGNGSRSFSTNAETGEKRVYSNAYNVELSSSWEIDLFGKISRSVEAADASYIASIYDREALVHTLIAQLLDLRVEIAVNKRLLDLAQRNAENRLSIYELVQRRYELGASNVKPQDVLRAKDNYTSVQADVHQFQRLLADATYHLDVVLGQTPGTTNPLQSDFPMIAPPIDAPVCLPADLLDRRPDLRAAELRVKAANADIGIAIADLYPSLNLTGVIGFSDDSTSNLLSPDQLAGSVLSSIMLRIFEGGALRANIKIQESEAREAAASYADEVLNALREVETSLKADSELSSELSNANASVDALTAAENILESRYLRGIERLQDLLDAQRDLYNAEQNLLNTSREKWNVRTSLYLALGGDWLGKGVEVHCNEGKNNE